MYCISMTLLEVGDRGIKKMCRINDLIHFEKVFGVKICRSMTGNVLAGYLDRANKDSSIIPYS